MVFTRFVEIGRVCLITYGEFEGKVRTHLVSSSRDRTNHIIQSYHINHIQSYHTIISYTIISTNHFHHQLLQLCAILDVIDQNKALVDGPEIPRQTINFRRISLTDIKMDIKRSIKTGKLDAAWKEQDVDGQWAKTVSKHTQTRAINDR